MGVRYYFAYGVRRVHGRMNTLQRKKYISTTQSTVYLKIPGEILRHVYEENIRIKLIPGDGYEGACGTKEIRHLQCELYVHGQRISIPQMTVQRATEYVSSRYKSSKQYITNAIERVWAVRRKSDDGHDAWFPLEWYNAFKCCNTVNDNDVIEKPSQSRRFSNSIPPAIFQQHHRHLKTNTPVTHPQNYTDDVQYQKDVYIAAKAFAKPISQASNDSKVYSSPVSHSGQGLYQFDSPGVISLRNSTRTIKSAGSKNASDTLMDVDEVNPHSNHQHEFLFPSIATAAVNCTTLESPSIPTISNENLKNTRIQKQPPISTINCQKPPPQPSSSKSKMTYTCPFDMFEAWWKRHRNNNNIISDKTALQCWDSLFFDNADVKNVRMSRQYWIRRFAQYKAKKQLEEQFTLEYQDEDGSTTVLDPDEEILQSLLRTSLHGRRRNSATTDESADAVDEVDQYTVANVFKRMAELTGDPLLLMGAKHVDIRELPGEEWTEQNVRAYLRRPNRQSSLDLDPQLISVKSEKRIAGGVARKFLCEFVLPSTRLALVSKKNATVMNTVTVWVRDVELGCNPRYSKMIREWEVSPHRVIVNSHQEHSDNNNNTCSVNVDNENKSGRKIPKEYAVLRLLGDGPNDVVMENDPNMDNCHFIEDSRQYDDKTLSSYTTRPVKNAEKKSTPRVSSSTIQKNRTRPKKTGRYFGRHVTVE